MSKAVSDERQPLTDRQASILRAIVAHVAATGVYPTLRELCGVFDISSANGVAVHLASLRRKGWLCPADGDTRVVARSLRVVGLDDAIRDAAAKFLGELEKAK